MKLNFSQEGIWICLKGKYIQHFEHQILCFRKIVTTTVNDLKKIIPGLFQI